MRRHFLNRLAFTTVVSGIFAMAGVLAVSFGPMGAARAQSCGLALVLAVDVSPSVDGREYRLQMEGLANAFRDPAVINAVKAIGGVAATVTLWSTVKKQDQRVPWTYVGNEVAAEAFAQAILAVPWPHPPWGDGTAIGAAVVHAANLLAQVPYRCDRQVIDVSGDGRSIVGPEPKKIRDLVTGLGVTINGIAVLSDEPKVEDYYRENVIGGPGAFVIAAKSYEEFDHAIRKKILRELQPKLALNRLDMGWPVFKEP